MARFKARARAVDMLGRQQIAGIPTAISELFKNAHDAYAECVEVDFYRSDGLFVLRDDGVGMSREDFEGRWLTLGTESKVGGAVGLRPPPIDISKPRRPVLGEKGIGRLAIAAIGPQVLVLTRARETEELVAGFIHWGLFRLPGVDLDEIEIPVRTFLGGTLPNANDVREMVQSVRMNFETLSRHADPDLRRRIGAELDVFVVDPSELHEFLGAPSLAGSGHGTHFYIMPAEESLTAAIEGGADEDTAPALTKMLVGFTNTMTPGHPPVSIRTAFRDHKIDDLEDDLIEERAFFTPDEFRNADHHIEGHFDQFGQFVGTVTVYGDTASNHVVPWTRARGRPTECGPFKINVAVIQGLANQSTLPTEEWVGMIRKLNRIGGLYIYRDGIRVLPYGNNDYDFLDIERNRTKSASDYYFSYRRIFGVIEISGKENGELVEKAGREGFRENKAYRQFRDILKNFFVQIATDFFREGGTQAEKYYSRRAEIDRLERARRAREKQVGMRRAAFREKLDSVLDKLRDGTPAHEVTAVITKLERDLAAAAESLDPDRAALAFIEAETLARRSLADIRERHRLVPPRGVGLPKIVRRNLELYREQYERFVSGVFEPAQTHVEQLIGGAAEQARIAVDRRLRFDRALSELTSEAKRVTQSETHLVRGAAQELHQRVTSIAKESIADVDRVVKEVLSRAARLDVSRLDDDVFVLERTTLEEQVQQAAESQRRLLTSIAEQLRSVTWSDGTGDDSISSADMAEALEDEVLQLRERSEADLELAQLGMAIQVINHEFDHTIKSVRTSIRELRAWADANTALQSIYTNIRRNFDHLDGYLTLFTPLQRRLYRTKVTFTGADILKFLLDLFEERLERERVSLDASAAFKRHAISGYPSSFYPVFVNLVDNALYWLQHSVEPHTISADVKNGIIIMWNSGPAIPERDRDEIFEQGFSRKPGGRGLGLHISRQVLNREGWTIRAIEPPSHHGAAFAIEPLTEALESKE
jgi:signal transduction histidine kinase